MSLNNTTYVTYSSNINMTHWKLSYYIVCSIIIVVGATINLWMLTALMTSPDMRSNMRNKLVCVTLFNNSIRSGFISLLEIIEVSLAFETDARVDCGYGTFVRIMRFSFMWIENWYVLIFYIHYISTQLEFNPVDYLSPKKLKIGTILILAGPWIFSVIVGPAVLAGYSHKTFGVHEKGCVLYTFASFKTLGQFGIVTPYFINYALIVVILILHLRRKNQYTSMNTSLIRPETYIDDVQPYIVIFVVGAITQILLVLKLVADIRMRDVKFNFVFFYLSWYLSEGRCVAVAPAFLLFKDIRNRIKIWRPWYRPSPGIDLSVQFNQTNDDV